MPNAVGRIFLGEVLDDEQPAFDVRNQDIAAGKTGINTPRAAHFGVVVLGMRGRRRQIVPHGAQPVLQRAVRV